MFMLSVVLRHIMVKLWKNNLFQELELLPVKELQNNIYIKHPVSMEQYLMEGSFNKVCQPVNISLHSQLLILPLSCDNSSHFDRASEPVNF